MNKEYIVKLPKVTLVIYENEFWKLPKDTLINAIKRGKSYKRALSKNHFEEENVITPKEGVESDECKN